MLAASSLTGTQGLIALAAAAVAVLAIVSCTVLAVKMRGMRNAQRAVLGQNGKSDLVAHAARIQREFEALHEYVSEMADGLGRRLGDLERAGAHAISRSSLVRYDAYNEQSGAQSMSIALLDETRSGVVLTCIHHRDQARVYAKELRQGRSERELSPEEAEAVRIATSAPVVEDDVATEAS